MIYYGWLVMLGCIVCQMDLGFAKDAMDVYMTYIVAEMGWTRADFQVAGWVTIASYSAASPAVGYVLDRFGARAVLSFGALSLGAVLVSYSQMSTFGHYLAVTPLLGFGLVAVGDVPTTTVVSRWFDRHRGRVVGLVLIGSNLGAATVNLLAKGVYRGFGDDWRAGLLVIAALVVGLVLPFTLFVIRDRQADEVPAEDRAAGAEGPRRSLRLREAASTPALWILVFALFAYYFYYLFVNRHIIALLRDAGSFGHRVPPALTSLLGIAADDFPELCKSAFEVVGIPAKLAAGLLADRYRSRFGLAWCFVALALASTLFPFLSSSTAMVAFIVVHGAAWGAQQVLTPMTLAEVFGLRNMGQIYGTLMLVLFPAQLGSWLAAATHDATGSYAAFFPYCIALNAAAAAALFFLRSARR